MLDKTKITVLWKIIPGPVHFNIAVDNAKLNCRNLLECLWLVISDEGGAQSYDQPGGDGPSLGSGRNVRVVHLRPTMKKHCSVDNILSQCTDL